MPEKVKKRSSKEQLDQLHMVDIMQAAHGATGKVPSTGKAYKDAPGPEWKSPTEQESKNLKELYQTRLHRATTMAREGMSWAEIMTELTGYEHRGKK